MFTATLLHSVSYSGSWRQAFLTTEQFIDKAADLGFNGVLLMAKRPHLSPLDFDGPARARLRSRIEARDLKKVAIAGYNNFTADLEHGEVPQREMQVFYITELARLAHDLGGDLVRVFTGYEHPASNFTAAWNLIVGGLKECAQRAAELGVTIGVQNHHDIGVGWESFHDLINAVNEPNCKALFDAWAPALHGADLVAGARRLAPITAHTTIADYVLRPRYRYHPQLVNYTKETPYVQAVPMGEGFIDYNAFLKALAAGGFAGSVAYEMCSPLIDGGGMETLDRYARRFLEWIAGFRPGR